MRGVGYTLSRLPAARAFIAGAAILAGTVPTASARDVGIGEETAFAMPRIAPATGAPAGGVDLPQPLAPSDAALLRRVFDLQARGDFEQAASLLPSLNDALLIGHVMAQRYLQSGPATPASDLAEWLARYADHPDAPAIHAMLLARLPSGMAAPAPPTVAPLPADAAAPPEEAEPAAMRLVRNPLLDRTVRERAHAGNADSALHLLAKTRGLDALYGNQLRAEIAQALFTQGRDGQAYRTGEDAFRRSGGRVALAGYVAGLAAWRLERADVAQPLFEQASRAELATPSLRAAAAFWAARAHQRNRDPGGSGPWMHKAAEERRTFYGLLARRSLGLGPNLSTVRETLGSADVEALLAIPAGKRAFALIQVGQPRRAEAELRVLWTQAPLDSAMAGSILRVAQAAGLVDLAAQLAGILEAADGRMHDDARFPIPPLHPAGGFRMDPALVYALTRLESNFDTTAVSGAGARGLMQVTPVTAGFLAGRSALASAGYAQRLHEPAINLSVGQSYLVYLSAMDGVAGDLIHLLGCYNAGPTSFARMVAGQATVDPLLFIESIPNDETRAYIPRALTYSWIYATRLQLPAASLDELAAGEWPGFHTTPPRREAMPRLH